MNKRILIAGSGALATLFAYRLSKAGVDVTMLGSWREGLAALGEEGARLHGKGGQPVRTTDNPVECNQMEYALVLVKSWQTNRVARQLAGCLGRNGLALTLQNGLGNDLILEKALDPERVSRGVTTLGATLLAPGLVSSNEIGEVIIEQHPKLSGIVELLRIANIEGKVVEDARPAIWGKLMVNAAINPLAALLRLKNGDLVANQEARVLMGELARETAAVAQAKGVELPNLPPEQIVEDVALKTADNTASMLQDVLRGGRTEVDAINGAIVREGRQTGVLTPVNRVIAALVKAIPVHGKIFSFPPIGGD